MALFLTKGLSSLETSKFPLSFQADTVKNLYLLCTVLNTFSRKKFCMFFNYVEICLNHMYNVC